MPAKGVCYVAIGEQAEQEAHYSREALRKGGAWDVKVLAEQPEGMTPAQASRWNKTHLDLLSPFEDTLYLDADTRPHGDLSAGFEILSDGWDMVMCPSTQQGDDWLWHVSAIERDATRREAGDLLQLQAGVFFFRKNERTLKLFETWRSEWQRWQGEDQGAFLRALAGSPVRLWLLGQPWNGGAVISHRFGACRR